LEYVGEISRIVYDERLDEGFGCEVRVAGK
jgi:hypothetical protein